MLLAFGVQGIMSSACYVSEHTYWCVIILLSSAVLIIKTPTRLPPEATQGSAVLSVSKQGSGAVLFGSRQDSSQPCFQGMGFGVAFRYRRVWQEAS